MSLIKPVLTAVIVLTGLVVVGSVVLAVIEFVAQTATIWLALLTAVVIIKTLKAAEAFSERVANAPRNNQHLAEFEPIPQLPEAQTNGLRGDPTINMDYDPDTLDLDTDSVFADNTPDNQNDAEDTPDTTETEVTPDPPHEAGHNDTPLPTDDPYDWPAFARMVSRRYITQPAHAPDNQSLNVILNRLFNRWADRHGHFPSRKQAFELALIARDASRHVAAQTENLVESTPEHGNLDPNVLDLDTTSVFSDTNTGGQ